MLRCPLIVNSSNDVCNVGKWTLLSSILKTQAELNGGLQFCFYILILKMFTVSFRLIVTTKRQPYTCDMF